MIDVELSETPGVPVLVRSFAACLASATETPLHEVPQPATDLSGAFAHWRSWCAGRGVGLVSIRNPAAFTWPGYWLAVVGGARPGGRPDEADDLVVVVMFGTPSGVVVSPQDPTLLGRAAADLPVRDGYVVSGLDPAAVTSTAAALPVLRGTVELVALAAEATGGMRVVEQATALARRGLDGDRYAARAGTFTPADPTVTGYDLTLIEAEALEDLHLPHGPLAQAEARRNLVTRGIDLNALVGRRFRVGDVECLGQRLAEPCSHLERLTTRGVLRGLIHRGGLRADVLTDGRIATGDTIETID